MQTPPTLQHPLHHPCCTSLRCNPVATQCSPSLWQHVAQCPPSTPPSPHNGWSLVLGPCDLGDPCPQRGQYSLTCSIRCSSACTLLLCSLQPARASMPPGSPRPAAELSPSLLCPVSFLLPYHFLCMQRHETCCCPLPWLSWGQQRGRKG